MDYEKLYKEANIKVAVRFGSNVAKELFPDLYESNDERIRKEIISMSQTLGRTEWIAWLEKQGEQNPIDKIDSSKIKKDPNPYWTLAPEYQLANKQKPADKVEPKFKVGDWITDNNSTFQIVRVENEWYYADDGDKICFDVAHQYYHLWTINDAEDGDVLSYRDGQWIFIYKGIVTEDTFKYYSLLSEKDITVNDAAFTLLASCIIPATKEQRDFLFKKMKEAGYEWDAENKELKKIEQKFKVGDKIRRKTPSSCDKDMQVARIEKDYYVCNHIGKLSSEVVPFSKESSYDFVEQNYTWSEEDEAIYYGVIETEQYMLDVVYGKKEFNVGSESIKEECQKELDWLKSLKERVQPQPKQEWGEEDDVVVKDVCDKLNRLSMTYVGNESIVCQKEIKWLKSLKDRVQPKQEWKQENTGDLTDFENVMMHIGNSFFGDNAGLNPNDTNAIKEQANLLLELVPVKEWSEEDKVMLNEIIDFFENGTVKLQHDLSLYASWLKSLRPQNTWKPSDEQMEDLSRAVNGGTYRTSLLMELYQDLKKLKGE